MLTLYHARTSVCAIKVRLALAEKGLSWESKLLTLKGDQFDPAYMKLNPNAVVPTLFDDGSIVTDSTVIVQYLDDIFPDPPLMPIAPIDRAKCRLFAKLIDERIHDSCIALSFATANRPALLSKNPEELEAELDKSPIRASAEAKRQAARSGLYAPLVVEAVRNLVELLDRIGSAVKSGSYIAGDGYSLADIVATPYIWRLEMLRLAHLWENRPEFAAWYDRIRGRPSFTEAVEEWMTQADIDKYANFEPDPWPRIQEIMRGFP